MKNRRIAAQLVAGIFLTALTLTLTACTVLYKVPENNFAGRPIPPSKMLQRVLATYTNGGTTGGAQILDGLRDLRGNVQNTKLSFPISGFSAPDPTEILNFPEQTHGYVLSETAGTLIGINYSTEASAGAAATFTPNPSAVGAAFDGSLFAAASSLNSQVYVSSGGGTYALNLPNVYKVAVNPGVTIILAMVRNSSQLYRVIRLPQSNNPVVPPGAVDCEPQLLPVYCVVPVPGTFDHPTNASFSLDGSTVYVLNCGPECGPATSDTAVPRPGAGISVLKSSALLIDNIPNTPTPPSAMASIGVPNPVPVPGGATVALSNGTTLYVAGQSLYSLGAGGVLGSTPRPDGLFTGYLTAVNLSNYSVSQPISVSDGTHTKLLFADDNTLWVGSQQCASGVRAATGQNYNCLTMVDLSKGPVGTAQVIPNVTPGGSTKVPFPNTNQNLYYYGDLTGICWVQAFHKVFTAYGGQIHVFYTGGTITDVTDPAVGTTPPAGSELDNKDLTIQGTVLDVAYMDAVTNAAN